MLESLRRWELLLLLEEFAVRLSTDDAYRTIETYELRYLAVSDIPKDKLIPHLRALIARPPHPLTHYTFRQ